MVFITTEASLLNDEISLSLTFLLTIGIAINVIIPIINMTASNSINVDPFFFHTPKFHILLINYTVNKHPNT